jgi:hypothetical protein
MLFSVIIEANFENGQSETIKATYSAVDAAHASKMALDNWINFLYTMTDAHRIVKNSTITAKPIPHKESPQ